MILSVVYELDIFPHLLISLRNIENMCIRAFDNCLFFLLSPINHMRIGDSNMNTKLLSIKNFILTQNIINEFF